MLLTPREVQEKLGLSRDRTYGLMHLKGFPRIKIGNRYYIEEDELQSFLKRNVCKNLILEK